MKKIKYIFLFFILTLIGSLAIIQFLNYSKQINYMNIETHKIIIDTDAGADDAAAIILAAKNPNIKILGITVVAGNVDLEQGAKNVLTTLDMVDNSSPVYLGANKPLSGNPKEVISVFGNDGMGDADLVHTTRNYENKSAVDFILETVKSNPNEVEIVTLGPVTNIALAINKDRETMLKVKRIWSMGTAGFGIGNATPVAEFNVYKDAYAYKTMLDLGVPITVVGLDMVDELTWISEEKLMELQKGNKLQNFFVNSFRKLLEFKKNNGCAAIDIPDAVTMGCLVWKDYIQETELCYGSCITDPGETHGLVIFYKDGLTYDSMPKVGKPNVSVVTKTKKCEFVKRLFKTLK